MGEKEKTHDGNCALVVETATEVRVLKQSDKDQWAAINKLQNRLPVWATLMFTVMGMLLGSAVTYASLAVKMAEAAK